MISSKSIDLYRRQYPEDEIINVIPSCFCSISNADRTMHVREPYDGEADEIFLDRLERSKKAGKNLFFEEWEEEKIKEGVLY